VIVERVNKKENRLAIRSAIAATANKEVVESRGHKIEAVPAIPLVAADTLETLTTTKEVRAAVSALGLEEDLLRAANGRKIRAGKGKMRGRKMKTPKSFLIVVGQDLGIGLAARNLPLAPGTHPGRLVLWTKSAIERLGGEGLFM
jgi:large subunit ribosomal protein L4e